MKYEIEKGVPVPTAKMPSKYPFAELKPGECLKLYGCNSRSSPAQMARRHARLNNLAVRVRTFEEDGEIGIRVWFFKKGDINDDSD